MIYNDNLWIACCLSHCCNVGQWCTGHGVSGVGGLSAALPVVGEGFRLARGHVPISPRLLRGKTALAHPTRLRRVTPPSSAVHVSSHGNRD